MPVGFWLLQQAGEALTWRFDPGLPRGQQPNEDTGDDSHHGEEGDQGELQPTELPAHLETQRKPISPSETQATALHCISSLETLLIQ